MQEVREEMIMSNPLFNALGGGMPQGNNPMSMMQQFQKFMGEMKGKNPTDEINKLLQSGRLNQQQLNQIQQTAQQMQRQGMFKGFFK